MQRSARSQARSPPHLLKPLRRQPTQVRAPASLVKRIARPNLAVIPFAEAAGTAASFRPTRRVRDAPGGPTHNIFGHTVDDDALASAPPRNAPAPTVAAPAASNAHGRFATPPLAPCSVLANYRGAGRNRPRSGTRTTAMQRRTSGRRGGASSLLTLIHLLMAV